jgi:hypothetical protein
MMGAESARNMYSVLAVVNKKLYCPKLHLVGSLYITELRCTETHIYKIHFKHFVRPNQGWMIRNLYIDNDNPCVTSLTNHKFYILRLTLTHSYQIPTSNVYMWRVSVSIHWARSRQNAWTITQRQFIGVLTSFCV